MNRSIAAQQSEHLPSTSSEQDAGTTITCSICQAAYTPSRSHAYLLRSSPIALESALMKMCHFCFRCRRPACPACWDDVHGVCGQCTENTGLPFRLEPAPVDGARFSPAHLSEALTRVTQAPLLNVRPGRFQKPSLPSIDDVPTRPDFIGPHPMGQRSRSLEIDEIETRPMLTSKSSLEPSLDVAAMMTRPERLGRGRVARALTLLLLALVILIALLFTAALLLPNVNTFLHKLLYIDIRTGMTRFWHISQYVF